MVWLVDSELRVLSELSEAVVLPKSAAMTEEATKKQAAAITDFIMGSFKTQKWVNIICILQHAPFFWVHEAILKFWLPVVNDDFFGLSQLHGMSNS